MCVNESGASLRHQWGPIPDGGHCGGRVGASVGHGVSAVADTQADTVVDIMGQWCYNCGGVLLRCGVIRPMVCYNSSHLNRVIMPPLL